MALAIAKIIVEKNSHDHDFIKNYITAMRQQDFTITSATNEAITDTLITFPFYSAVVYILGEESTVDETFSDALDRGGAHAVTIDNVPSLEWFQAIPNGKSRLIDVYTWNFLAMCYGER